jgi:hypothetical protein
MNYGRLLMALATAAALFLAQPRAALACPS